MALDKINDNIEREFNKHLDADWEKATIAERNAIPLYKRYPGMECNVQDKGDGNPQLYKLNVKRGGDLSDNTKWVPFIPTHVESITEQNIEEWNNAATGNVTIIDNLTTEDPGKALSANMGVVLAGLIGALQQDINNLSIGDISGLTEALAALAIENTDDLPEGVENLYFTAQRVLDTAIANLTSHTGSIQNGDTILVALGKLQSQINNINSGGASKGILSGGVMWSGTGLIYDVAVHYNYYGETGSASGQVTAAPGDSIHDRIDAFVVDNQGNLSIIAGEPSINPLQPEIGEEDILIQLLVVSANSTAPTVTQLMVYDENDPQTEWAPSVYTLFGSPVAVDFGSQVNPHHGTYRILTELSNNTGIRFTNPDVPVLTSQYSTLSLWVFLEFPLKEQNTRFLLFANNSGEDALLLNNYGLNHTLVGTWQHLIIPTADLHVTEITDLYLRCAGEENGKIGVDWIMLTTDQNTTPGETTGIKVYSEEALVGETKDLNFGPGFSVSQQGEMVDVDYTEEDPTVGTHVKAITEQQIENWDNAAIVSGQSGKYIVSGGAVWSGTGLKYNVNVVYNYFGTTGSASDSIVLNPADANLPRIDAIVVNSAGDIYAKEGTAALEAMQPAIGEDEILIQIATINAGALEPAIIVNTVYNEATEDEWSRTSYQLEGAIDGTVDFEYPTGAFNGSVCIRSHTTRTTGLRFYVASPINFMQFSALVFRVKLPAPLPAGRKLLSSVWLNNMPVGSVLNFTNYGLNPALVDEWQTIITPTSAYGVFLIDRIHLRMEGPAGSTVQIEYFVDTISFSTEEVTETTPPVLIGVEQQSALIGNTGTLNFGDNFQVTAQTDGKVKVEYTGDGAGAQAKLTTDTTFFEI